MPNPASLTIRQEKFVDALTTPNTDAFCNPIDAYRVISPSILPQSASIGAIRMSKNVKVREAIRGQLGLDKLGSKLKKCLRETEKLKDWAEVRAVVMDYAKLTGQLVEKREVRNLNEQDLSSIRSLVSSVLTS